MCQLNLETDILLQVDYHTNHSMQQVNSLQLRFSVNPGLEDNSFICKFLHSITTDTTVA